MRVLLVAPFPGWKWVSTNRYAASIARAAPDAGVTVAVGQAPWWNPPSVARGLHLRYRHAAAFREHRHHPFDVVHLADHALGHHVDWLGRPAPTVVTCHDLMALEEPAAYWGNAVTGAVKAGFLRHSVNGMLRATRIVAVSQATADQLVRFCGVDPARISVVPFMSRRGLGPVADPRAALRAFGIDLPGGPLVLSVGHTGAYKNLELLLHALASPVLRGATLLRVGGRLTRSQRRVAAKLDVDGRIVELGHVRAAALPALYSASAVLAQPSKGEGFGAPVVEAMACGLPVVVSDRGALPEVVDRAGIVVPLGPGFAGGDADADARLAAALASVIDDAQLAERLREAGLVRARDFRPEVVMPRLVQVYRAALAEYRGTLAL
jgi:glycosyltransferase involved in cell wall biosynthesis